MERSLENVHVEIFGFDMLRCAIDTLNELGQPIEETIELDFLDFGNDKLIFHEGVFKVVENPIPERPLEITLNSLFELVTDKTNGRPQRGDICKFWDKSENIFVITRLHKFEKNRYYISSYEGHWYRNARKLSKEKVNELLFGKGSA